MPALAPLPIDDVLPAFVAALRDHSAAVLHAPTGSGKTTRVPGAILDAGIVAGQVLVLEPRRVAARAAARRIAWERGGSLGDEVGYQVRFDQRISSRTRIRIVTDGVLLRLLQDDPFLEPIGAVVFDEFHERGLNVDLSLAMVRRIQESVRPDLKIVAMSATLDMGSAGARGAGQSLPQFLGNCPVVAAEGRLYPVTVQHRSFGKVPIPAMAATAVAEILDLTAGDVLVFLPGVGEIRRTQEELAELTRTQNLAVMPLYGDLPAEQQDAVLQPCNRRKIVLATNVAETSLTIEGVTGVVDTGYARVLRFDAALGLDRLELERISRASADQRAGRAGRTQPGVCLRLWSERDQSGMPEFETPEVRRVDLAGPVLQLRCWGENPEEFPWFESPGELAVEQAQTLLRRLEAVDDRGPTELGHAMSRLPIHPRLARLLLEGQRLGITDRAALAAALLAERDPFLRDSGPGRRRKAEHHSESDVVDRVTALEDFQRQGTLDSETGRVNPGAARNVVRVRDQLLDLLPRAAADRQSNRFESDDAVRQALFAAFCDRLARRREPGGRTGRMVGGRGVRLADESAVAEAELFVCVDVDAGLSDALVRQASAVDRDWLPEDGLSTSEEFGFDPQTERVTAVRRTLWLDLPIGESSLPLPDDDRVAQALAEAAGLQLDRVIPKDDELRSFRARVRCLRAWRPELELPDLDDAQLVRELPLLCRGCRSLAELRRASWLAFLKGLLTWPQLQSVDREAPERLLVPSGKRIVVRYEEGQPPVLAVRIQELFGLAETPRIAGGKVPVVLHLLAPNMRPQQITTDLQSFWINTYPQVRKDLRRRYPKHAWPERPWEDFGF